MTRRSTSFAVTSGRTERLVAAILTDCRRACSSRAGHSLPGEKQDASEIAYTQAYLRRFEAELGKASNSGELISAMKTAYPAAGLGVALDIGAKVNKGEMKW